MRHAGTQEIETPRLLLRRLMPSDAPMMYTNWANDPEVTRWLRWTPHKDVAETQELLSLCGLAELYPKVRRDAIIIYGLLHGMDLFAVNDRLFSEDEETLF